MPRPKTIPRGIRNNNPLNIRIGNVWLGEVEHPSDPSFEQFVSMQYGVRAACVLLRRYIRHYKRTNIRSIIAAWAPSYENNTEAYVEAVSRYMEISPDDIIKYEDKDTICHLVQAMCQVENGQPISDDIISKGYDMA